MAFSSTGAIDPKRKLFIFMGRDYNGTVPRVYAIDISAGSTYDAQDWTKEVTGCDGLAGVDYPGLTYDPVQDWIVGWPNEGSSVYLFDPATKTCTVRTFTDGPTNKARTANGAGTFGRFQYVPALNAHVIVADDDMDAYLFRLPAPGMTP